MLNLNIVFDNSKSILFFNKCDYFFRNINYILSLYIANTNVALTINISTKKKLKSKIILIISIMYILS